MIVRTWTGKQLSGLHKYLSSVNWLTRISLSPYPPECDKIQTQFQLWCKMRVWARSCVTRAARAALILHAKGYPVAINLFAVMWYRLLCFAGKVCSVKIKLQITEHFSQHNIWIHFKPWVVVAPSALQVEIGERMSSVQVTVLFFSEPLVLPNRDPAVDEKSEFFAGLPETCKSCVNSRPTTN